MDRLSGGAAAQASAHPAQMLTVVLCLRLIVTQERRLASSVATATEAGAGFHAVVSSRHRKEPHGFHAEPFWWLLVTVGVFSGSSGEAPLTLLLPPPVCSRKSALSTQSAGISPGFASPPQRFSTAEFVSRCLGMAAAPGLIPPPAGMEPASEAANAPQLPCV